MAAEFEVVGSGFSGLGVCRTQCLRGVSLAGLGENGAIGFSSGILGFGISGLNVSGGSLPGGGGSVLGIERLKLVFSG